MYTTRLTDWSWRFAVVTKMGTTSGHEVCRSGSRVFREVRVSNFAGPLGLGGLNRNYRSVAGLIRGPQRIGNCIPPPRSIASVGKNSNAARYGRGISPHRRGFC